MHTNDLMFQRYMDDIQRYPLITAEKEKELANIIQTSDDPKKVTVAKEELVVANLKLVVKYALDYYSRLKNVDDVNVSLMDLINEGNIGLMRAAELFQSKKNVRFSTYAYSSIQRQVKRACKQSRFIHLPMDHFKYSAELKNLEEKYEKDGKKLTDEIIIHELKITSNMLALVRANRIPTISFEGLEEFLEGEKDENMLSADEGISQKELKNYLFEKMKELNPLERDILYLKFFSNCEMTLQDIGRREGVSRERVRQLLPKALKNLHYKIKEEVAIANSSTNKLDFSIWNKIKIMEEAIKNEINNEKERRSVKDECKQSKGKCKDESKEQIEPKKRRPYRTHMRAKNLPFFKFLGNA